MNLQGAKVLVTGGSSGIGKATAKLLKEAGADVIITGRNNERLNRAAESTGTIPFTADVADPSDVDYTFKFVQETLGGLDVLINNAGFGEFSNVGDLSFLAFHKVFSTNVYGAAMMASRASKIFKAQSSGNIINIGSTAGTKGYENGSIYVGSKFALRGMTECWRAELRKHNVRVMLVNPSEVTTAFGRGNGDERSEQPKKLRPLDIAHAIKALLEMDDRSFIPELQVWATNPF